MLPLPPGRSSQIRCDFCQSFVNDFIDFLHLNIFRIVFFCKKANLFLSTCGDR
ncbi:hypothetical protein ETC03_17400 [Geobacillus sp. MMMUD3]|nr:hypothetical protein [Geobacillus sp. MMMUD3]